MAIINNAHAGSQINLLCLIYRVLRRANAPLTIDEITNLCRPETLLRKKDHKKRFIENLNFWMKSSHNMWVLDKQNKIVLTCATQSEQPSPYEIADVTRGALFKDEIDDIMGDDVHDVESLLRTIACILISDRFQSLDNEVIDKVALDKLVGEYLLPQHALNDSEKPTLLEYGQFLGFLEPKERGCYVVDVTRAISSILPEIFHDVSSMGIREFVNSIGIRLPVLDGGAYQQQVKRIMHERGWKSKKQSDITKALSHALERLSIDKVIRLDAMADDSHAMQIQFHNKQRSISSIMYIEGK